MSDIRRTSKPKILYEENQVAFNKAVTMGKVANLSNQNLSDLDLVGFNLAKANLEGAYLRGANLSGQDLSGASLGGASLKHAKISGCLFPVNISAEEIRLSVDLGTRLRYLSK